MSANRFDRDTDGYIPTESRERRVNITDLRDRVVIIEEKLNHYNELHKEELALSREQMAKVQTSLDRIEEQTAKWSNIFWGVTIGVTTIFGILSWILNTLGIDMKAIIHGIK